VSTLQMLEEWLRAGPRIATALEQIADEMVQARIDRRQQAWGEAPTVIREPGEWPQPEER
jgi:hypothetical protein